MPAHRRPSARSGARRTLSGGLAGLLGIAGFLLASAVPAHAATTWYVAPTGGTTTACAGTQAAPCATVTLVIAKAAFTGGDTINVAAGTYADHPLFGAKGANVVGTDTGVVFDGSGTSWAVGANLASGQTLSLTNLTLRNGGWSTGGTLPVAAGAVTTTGVTISGGKAVYGGGSYVTGGSSLTMHGGAVAGNSATANTTALSGAGGGIYVAGRQGAVAAGKLVLDGVAVNNNVATGAAASFSGNGGGVFNAGTTTITGGTTFSGNQAVASTASTLRSGQGGAIFNGPQDADDQPSLTIDATTITGGLSGSALNATSGGGIANDETSFGGTSASGVLSAIGVTLTGNTAVAGGGLYTGGSTTFTGGSFDSNAAANGGAVVQAPLVSAASHGTADFNGTTFTSNVATGGGANSGNGGAIFNTRAVTIENARFTGNQAVPSSVASTVSGWGGALFNGPFAANDAPTATITDTQILGGSPSSNASIGGAIADAGNAFNFSGASNARLDATRLTVSGNAALAGGGVYAGGPATLTASSLDHNKATHTSNGYGGGLYAAKLGGSVVSVTVDGTDLTQNSATVLGGGLAVLNGATVDVRNGSHVNTNNSAVSGGGAYASGTLTITGSHVDGNSAAWQGGGVYNGSSVVTDTPSVTLTDSTVSNNTAANVGGGLVTIKGAAFTASGGAIDGNSALGGGGAYVADNAPASFDGTTFAGNTSSSSGGGALFNSGTTTLTHARIQGNHGVHTTGNTGLAAGIYSGSNTANVTTKLTVIASTIAGNDGYAGSALVTFSPGSGSTNATSIRRSTIAGNTNTSSTGAIEQFHPLTIRNSTITDNTASGGPGALAMVAPNSVGITGTIVSNNGATSCSGKPVDGGYNLSDPGDTSCGFSSAKNDVAKLPQLGDLGDNGGPTPTRKPGPASPALDVVPPGTSTPLTDAVDGSAVGLCASGDVDQRGTSRPQGARCDIGSVEVEQVVPTVSGPASTDYSIGIAGDPVTFTATGTPQATLSESGSLPAGVTFHDNGDGTATLSGTPTSGPGGHYPITVTATNEAGHGSTGFDLVLHQAPVLGGPASDTFTVGQPGGPDEFTMTSGFPVATLSTDSTLPGGVTFTPEDGGKGSIGGMPTTGSGGVYPVVIKGSNGTAPDATFPFTLTVDEQPTISGPAGATFQVGSSDSSDEFTTTGTPTPTLSASGLPGGLSLTSTGAGRARITGTPANGTGGTYDATVIATNGIGDDATTTTHVVVDEAPELTGPTAARFVAGIASSAVFSSDGYPGATVTETGALPSGVTFVDDGHGVATLSGTAAADSTGTYDITIRASNGIDPDSVIHLTLTVVPQLAITTTSLPDAAVGTGYGATIVATGGQSPYRMTVTDGSLPAGLTMASDGTITGTPTGPVAASTFTVKVTDSDSPAETATRSFTITVGKGTSQLTTAAILVNGLGTVKATLTGGAPPRAIAGQTVVFTSNGTSICSAVSKSDGTASCPLNAVTIAVITLNGKVTASYAGSALWKPSTATGGLLPG